MPYITTKQSPIYRQLTFDAILDGEVDLSKMFVANTANTRTHFAEELSPAFLENYNFGYMISRLQTFNRAHEALFLEKNRQNLYEKFFIPKKSGGLREINAPKPELMNALRELKTIFEQDMFALYHTSAFAYVKQRSTIDCVKKHQQNESRWFAKFDFSNFFGNTTEEFVLKMFSEIFPFSQIVKYDDGKEALTKALSLCFLNGGLPQGTPISPTITNIMMIPIDHQMYNELRKRPEHFVFTRYADDLIISSRIDFNCGEIQDYIRGVLKTFDAPFTLKKEKTRYGSSAGKNWNLGVMLNKDNVITIGHQNKKYFKAMCHSYLEDKKKGKSWDLHDVQVFDGHISYYRMVEKEYIDHVIDEYNKKYGVNMRQLIREDMAS